MHKYALEHVSGGAYGMLVIDDAGGNTSAAPVGQGGIAQWLGSANELLLVASKDVTTKVWSGAQPGLAAPTEGGGGGGGGAGGSSGAEISMGVGGRLQGAVYRIAAGEWYRLRVLAMDADGAPSSPHVGHRSVPKKVKPELVL